jgi:hypothetical protein
MAQLQFCRLSSVCNAQGMSVCKEVTQSAKLQTQPCLVITLIKCTWSACLQQLARCVDQQQGKTNVIIAELNKE